MYTIMCCLCAKFEQNQSIHVRDMAAEGWTDARTDETQSISSRFGLSPMGDNNYASFIIN